MLKNTNSIEGIKIKEKQKLYTLALYNPDVCFIQIGNFLIVRGVLHSSFQIYLKNSAVLDAVVLASLLVTISILLVCL